MASSVYNVGTIRKILVCNFIFKCWGVHCSCTCFSSLCSGYGTCSKWFFFVYNLILIEEKMHVPVSVRFPDNAFNENMHMYCFHLWDVFLIYLLWQTQESIEQIFFDSWEKNKLLPAQFSVKFIMLPARYKLTCLHACQHNCDCAGLIDNPVY